MSCTPWTKSLVAEPEKLLKRALRLEQKVTDLAREVDQLREALGETQAATRALLNKVNVVTAFFRHGNPIPWEALRDLANRQIEVEEKLEKISLKNR